MLGLLLKFVLVLADMRRARDVGRVVEVVDVGSGDVVIEKDEKGQYGVSGCSHSRTHSDFLLTIFR